MKKSVRWCVLVVLLIGIYGAMYSPVIAESYARKIYPLIASVLSRFSMSFSFSLGDCWIYGSLLGVFLYAIRATIKRDSWKKTGIRLLEFFIWIYVWFYAAWGLNYFRQDFYVRTERSKVSCTLSDFSLFLQQYTDSLNQSFVSFETIDKELVAEEVRRGYCLIADSFGLNQPSGYLHPKSMMFPAVMSQVGVLGYMGPFFIEFNLNPQLLPVQYPFTYAHEMAHLLGVGNEAEANLYGYLICTRSSIPAIRFSGYLAMLPYLASNAARLLSQEEFINWEKTLRPEVLDVYNRKETFWQQQYNPYIGEIQSRLYNWFLKRNNIPTGHQNYSEVVALLIALELSE